MAQQVSKMTRLTPKQLAIKEQFIENYINASNAATGSTFDANANVQDKNVATLYAETNKDINIQIKRSLISKKIEELFGQELADQFNQELEDHVIYCHDETSFCLPYCVAISMYPYLTQGLRSIIRGVSKAPKHLSSYNGGFINLIFACSSQFAGAVATVEYLTHFDYFARKDYGDNYLETHKSIITQELQSVVYALNQPASARGK